MNPQSHCGNWGVPGRVLGTLQERISGSFFFFFWVRESGSPTLPLPVWREPIETTGGPAGHTWVDWRVQKMISACFGQWSLASSQICYLICLSVFPETGRGKDILPSGEEDSTSRTAARPSLAQCRALSVDWPGPRSPHRLYLTVQVNPSRQMQGQE